MDTLEEINKKIDDCKKLHDEGWREIEKLEEQRDIIRNVKILEDKVLSKLKWRLDSGFGSLVCESRDWDDILKPYWKLQGYHESTNISENIKLVEDDSTLYLQVDNNKNLDSHLRDTYFEERRNILIKFIQDNELVVSLVEIERQDTENMKEAIELNHIKKAFKVLQGTTHEQ